MKKLIIALALIGGANSLFAQSFTGGASASCLIDMSRHAKNIANSYELSLALTADQKQEVYRTVLLSYMQAMEAKNTDVDIHARERAISCLNLKEKFSNLLTDAQMLQYRQMNSKPELKEIMMKEKNGVLTWD